MSCIYKNVLLDLIKNNPELLEEIKDQTEEMCMTAVQKDVSMLLFVKEQTEEICIIAVKQGSVSGRFRRLYPTLQLVKNQTHKICETAVSVDGRSLQFVNDNLKTDDIVLTACLETRRALQYTANKPFSLVLDCLIVIEKDKHLIDEAKEVLSNVLVKQWLSDHL